MTVPDEARAIAAMQKVQALSADEIDELITAEIGTPMLGVFSALAHAAHPEADKQELYRVVHLMVLSYALRMEAER